MSILCSMVGASFAAPAAAGRTAKTVTRTGNATVSTAQFKFGTASALFDGTTNTALVVSESISETGPYTIEFWFRKTANAGDLFYTQTETTGRGVMYFGSNGDLLYDTYSTAQPDFNNTGTQLATAMTSNVWHHIAFVRNADMSVRVFVNGIVSASTGTSNVNFPTGGIWFGSRGYTGNMDEIRISNVARYNYNFPVVTAEFNNDAYTTLLLHCNGTNGSTSFPDDTATTRNAVVPVRTGNVITSTTQFKFGTASGYSDGTGDSLVAPAINLYGDWTIEGWFRPDSPYNTTADRLFFSFDPVYMMVTTGSNLMYIYIGGSAIGTTAIAAGQWHHIAFQQTGNQVQGFVNGVYQTARGWGGNGSTDIRIAGGASGTNYKGYFDEIRVSKICRYNTVGTTFTPPTAAFTNDSNTLLLLHLNGANNGTVFTDDNT